MFSLTNCFRSATRSAPRLRPTLPSIASSSRWKSSKPALLEALDVAAKFDPTAGDELAATVQSTDEEYGPIATKATAQEYAKPAAPRLQIFRAKPTTAFDYTPKGRYVPPRSQRKPFVLGPGAKESRASDIFHQLGINPLDEATNSTLLSHFVTDMGKIRSRAQTHLTWKSQRRLGKAIRRAKMMGIIPILSRRPLMSVPSEKRMPLKYQGQR